jgi:hypothetical protein
MANKRVEEKRSGKEILMVGKTTGCEIRVEVYSSN